MFLDVALRCRRRRRDHPKDEASGPPPRFPLASENLTLREHSTASPATSTTSLPLHASCRVDVLRTLPTLRPIQPPWDGRAWAKEADLLRALPRWRLSEVREALRRLRAECLVALDDDAASLVRLTDEGRVAAAAAAGVQRGR